MSHLIQSVDTPHGSALASVLPISSAVFFQQAAGYLAMALGGTRAECWLASPALVAAGVDPSFVRVFFPLRYVYWATTNACVLLACARVVGLHPLLSAAGAVATSLSMLFGLGTEYMPALSPSWGGLLFLAFLFGLTPLAIGVVMVRRALFLAHAQKDDTGSIFFLWLFAPTIFLVWNAFPVVFVLAQMGGLTPEQELIALPLLDGVSKVLLCSLVAAIAGVYTRADARVITRGEALRERASLRRGETETARALLRTFVGELRLPLRSLLKLTALAKGEVITALEELSHANAAAAAAAAGAVSTAAAATSGGKKGAQLPAETVAESGGGVIVLNRRGAGAGAGAGSGGVYSPAPLPEAGAGGAAAAGPLATTSAPRTNPGVGLPRPASNDAISVGTISNLLILPSGVEVAAAAATGGTSAVGARAVPFALPRPGTVGTQSVGLPGGGSGVGVGVGGGGGGGGGDFGALSSFGPGLGPSVEAVAAQALVIARLVDDFVEVYAPMDTRGEGAGGGDDDEDDDEDDGGDDRNEEDAADEKVEEEEVREKGRGEKSAGNARRIGKSSAIVPSPSSNALSVSGLGSGGGGGVGGGRGSGSGDGGGPSSSYAPRPRRGLDLARLHITSFPLPVVVESGVDTLGGLALRRGITVVVTVGRAVPLVTFGDDTRLRFLAMAFLARSLRLCGQGGRVEVRLASVGWRPVVLTSRRRGRQHSSTAMDNAASATTTTTASNTTTAAAAAAVQTTIPVPFVRVSFTDDGAGLTEANMRSFFASRPTAAAAAAAAAAAGANPNSSSRTRTHSPDSPRAITVPTSLTAGSNSAWDDAPDGDDGDEEEGEALMGVGGMVVARAVVEAMGGRVGITNVRGTGTMLFFEFPSFPAEPHTLLSKAGEKGGAAAAPARHGGAAAGEATAGAGSSGGRGRKAVPSASPSANPSANPEAILNAYAGLMGRPERIARMEALANGAPHDVEEGGGGGGGGGAGVPSSLAVDTSLSAGVVGAVGVADGAGDGGGRRPGGDPASVPTTSAPNSVGKGGGGDSRSRSPAGGSVASRRGSLGAISDRERALGAALLKLGHTNVR